MALLYPLKSLRTYFWTLLLLKTFGSIGPIITEIINQSLQSGVILTFFQQVEPKIRKPNLDTADLINCRPISKIPFLDKICEKVISVQLNVFFDVNSILDTFQSGP